MKLQRESILQIKHVSQRIMLVNYYEICSFVHHLHMSILGVLVQNTSLSHCHQQSQQSPNWRNNLIFWDVSRICHFLLFFFWLLYFPFASRVESYLCPKPNSNLRVHGPFKDRVHISCFLHINLNVPLPIYLTCTIYGIGPQNLSLAFSSRLVP